MSDKPLLWKDVNLLDSAVISVFEAAGRLWNAWPSSCPYTGQE